MSYTLHQLVTRAAQKTPEAEAVHFQGESLTYLELDLQSNRLAQALIQKGIRRGDRVGIYLHKSVAAVVAVYGIMKTGAAYVPVDPQAPGNRLGDIGTACGFSALITSSKLWGKVVQGFAAPWPMKTILFTDALPVEPLPEGVHPSLQLWHEALEAVEAKDPQISVVDQDLAYVLFTSGSTGIPKGVMLTHRNALTFIDWAVETFDVTASDRLSNHAPFNFDLSTFDIFAAAHAGACLCPVPEGLASFPVRMVEFVQKQRITIWYSVPMVLTLLVSHGKLSEKPIPTLRLILFAGEVFPIKHLRSLMLLVPGRRYFNLYGPTETNVCTYYEVTTPPEENAPDLPIGKACANTDVFALNDEGKKIERPGEEGLLYARGSIVMQGYFGRAEESAKSFIENPLAQGRVERLYCTGDLVTLDAEGNFLFIGRRDHMIKTRGYRVELGEIERRLHAHPAVHEAAVIPLPDPLIGNRLKACLSLHGGMTVTEMELKQYCASALPTYMIPDEIAIEEKLPRTGNDKIDRQLLRQRSLATVK